MDVRITACSQDGICANANRISNLLLNQTVLVIKGVPHRLTEIEIYYTSIEHPDPFNHCHPLQQLSGYWYFHSATKTIGSYKGGTYKGLDITCGSTNTYGGILIRSIELPNKSILEGPSKIVDYLLKQCGYDSIAALMTNHGDKKGILEVTDRTAPLYLTREPGLTSTLTVYSCPRVGLSLKQPSKDKYIYIMKPYRYLTTPKNIKKNRNLMILSLYHQGISETAIKQLTASPITTIQRHIGYDKDGAKMKLDFQQPYNLTRVEDVSKLYGHMQYMQYNRI